MTKKKRWTAKVGLCAPDVTSLDLATGRWRVVWRASQPPSPADGTDATAADADESTPKVAPRGADDPLPSCVIPGATPGPRTGHGMVLLDGGTEVHVIGGRTLGHVLADHFVFRLEPRTAVAANAAASPNKAAKEQQQQPGARLAGAVATASAAKDMVGWSRRLPLGPHGPPAVFGHSTAVINVPSAASQQSPDGASSPGGDNGTVQCILLLGGAAPKDAHAAHFFNPATGFWRPVRFTNSRNFAASRYFAALAVLPGGKQRDARQPPLAAGSGAAAARGGGSTQPRPQSAAAPIGSSSSFAKTGGAAPMASLLLLGGAIPPPEYRPSLHHPHATASDALASTTELPKHVLLHFNDIEDSRRVELAKGQSLTMARRHVTEQFQTVEAMSGSSPYAGGRGTQTGSAIAGTAARLSQPFDREALARRLMPPVIHSAVSTLEGDDWNRLAQPRGANNAGRGAVAPAEQAAMADRLLRDDDRHQPVANDGDAGTDGDAAPAAARPLTMAELADSAGHVPSGALPRPAS